MLKFHHTGCLVKNIDEAIESYRGLFQPESIGEKIFISSQEVYVCFIGMGEGIFIELVQPSSETSVVRNMMKKGITYYHKGFLVDDIDASIKMLEEKNYKWLQTFRSEAFNNKRCAFLMSPVMHLIELIEMN